VTRTDSLTETPECLLAPPPIGARIMDALLDLLHAMHLTGGVFLDAEFTAPWCVSSRVGPEDCRAFLPDPAHVVAYHYVMEGRLVMEVIGQPAVAVGAGEIILLPRNDPHRLGSSLDVPAVSADDLILPAADGGLARIIYGGGGERTRVMCGFLGSDRPNPPVASVLPPALTLAVSHGASGAWIESSLKFAAQELMTGQPGSTTVLAKLAELLFIEAVRQHVASLPDDESGWLVGVRDPIVGRALALLHNRQAYRWTTEELAHEAGASRSAFADRFTSLMGEPPMRYLARRRLQFAADRLRESQESVAGIAFDAGYESEAAFSRAFKREFGKPPAAWRKDHPES
jgi:AraC-like DNA-binding protein